MGTDITVDIADLVRSNGDEVATKEPPCVLWKAEHENCWGCQYELGCGKVVYLMLLMLNPYTPKDYNDFVVMQEHIKSLRDRVLGAKTPKELKAIPHQ